MNVSSDCLNENVQNVRSPTRKRDDRKNTNLNRLSHRAASCRPKPVLGHGRHAEQAASRNQRFTCSRHAMPPSSTGNVRASSSDDASPSITSEAITHNSRCHSSRLRWGPSTGCHNFRKRERVLPKTARVRDGARQRVHYDQIWPLSYLHESKFETLHAQSESFHGTSRPRLPRKLAKHNKSSITQPRSCLPDHVRIGAQARRSRGRRDGDASPHRRGAELSPPRAGGRARLTAADAIRSFSRHGLTLGCRP